MFDFSGEVAVDLNIQLVIDTDFNNDLLNRSSNKFMAMEEKIRTAVRKDFVCLKGVLPYAIEQITPLTSVWIHRKEEFKSNIN